MALLEASHLHKRFGDHVVLEDISLSFAENRVSGIMGPNGAGKSTCFNVLTGLHKPDRGRILYDGNDITELPPHKIVQMGISRSFQIMSLFQDFTPLDCILAGLPEVRRRGMNMFHDLRQDSAAQDKAAEILRKVGLQGKERSDINALPYGERRALDIAIALSGKARLLFLDEPTAGMGTDGRNALAELIESIQSDLTIVLIEHDMDFLLNVASQVFVIHWGQVVAQGSPEELEYFKWSPSMPRETAQ